MYKIHNPGVFELYYKKAIRERIYTTSLNIALDFAAMVLSSEEWIIDEI